MNGLLHADWFMSKTEVLRSMGRFHHLLLKEGHFWSLPEMLIHLPGRNSSMSQDSQCAKSFFSIREKLVIRLRATLGAMVSFSLSPAWSS